MRCVLSGYPSFFLLLGKPRSKPAEEDTANVHEYEVAVIVRPDVDEDGQEQIIERLSQLLVADGGEVKNVETWGRRALAYPINKVNEGYYYFIQGQFSSTVLPEVDRTVKLSEEILRHMVIRQDK